MTFCDPETVRKSTEGETTYTFIWRYGEQVTLSVEEIIEGPGAFNQRYAESWGTDPAIPREEWAVTVNRWLNSLREKETM